LGGSESRKKSNPQGGIAMPIPPNRISPAQCAALFRKELAVAVMDQAPKK
jgi:hypothetical protein